MPFLLSMDLRGWHAFDVLEQMLLCAVSSIDGLAGVARVRCTGSRCCCAPNEHIFLKQKFPDQAQNEQKSNRKGIVVLKLMAARLRST